MKQPTADRLTWTVVAIFGIIIASFGPCYAHFNDGTFATWLGFSGIFACFCLGLSTIIYWATYP